MVSFGQRSSARAYIAPNVLRSKPRGSGRFVWGKLRASRTSTNPKPHRVRGGTLPPREEQDGGGDGSGGGGEGSGGGGDGGGGGGGDGGGDGVYT